MSRGPTRPRAAVAVVTLALVVDMFLYGSLVPLLPELPAVAGSSGAAGLLFAAYAVAMLVATPVVGRWVDRSGPRAPLLAGLIALAWLRALHSDRRFAALMTVSLRAAGSPGALAEKAAGFHAWRDRLRAALAELPGDAAPAAGHLLAWLSGTALLAGHDPALVPPADATSVRPVLEGILP